MPSPPAAKPRPLPHEVVAALFAVAGILVLERLPGGGYTVFGGFLRLPSTGDAVGDELTWAGLPPDVRPGETAELHWSFELPDVEGELDLVADVKIAGWGWLHQRGSEARSFRVRISSRAAGAFDPRPALIAARVLDGFSTSADRTSGVCHLRFGCRRRWGLNRAHFPRRCGLQRQPSAHPKSLCVDMGEAETLLSSNVQLGWREDEADTDGRVRPE